MGRKFDFWGLEEGLGDVDLTRDAYRDILDAIEYESYPSVYQMSRIIDILNLIFDYTGKVGLGVGNICFDCNDDPHDMDCYLTWICLGAGQGSGTGCRCGIYAMSNPDDGRDIYVMLLRNEGKHELPTTVSEYVPYHNIDKYIEMIWRFMVENRMAGVDSCG